MNPVTELLRAHRSIRKFSDEAVDDNTVTEIVACAQAAATSSNVQATTVIRIRDAARREQLAGLAGGQSYVASSAVFLVFCADLNRTRLACGLQDTDMVEGMTEHFMIATIDVALAAQNAVIAAESLGLGICYIGGLRNNPAAVSDLLSLPDQVYPVFGLCLGHPAQDPEVKPRLATTAGRQGVPATHAGFPARSRHGQTLNDIRTRVCDRGRRPGSDPSASYLKQSALRDRT